MVHAYSALGVNIAVDVESGAVHVLDELMLSVIKALGENGDRSRQEVRSSLSHISDSEFEEAWNEISELRDKGELFAPAQEYDASLPYDPPVKALCLHVAHDCNLRCKYCFASTGDFGTGRRRMDFEMAKKAVDFVVSKSGDRRNIEIDFFGGEPLMAMDTIKKTVDYAREQGRLHGKNFRFTITTNGVLLSDENIDYINREMDNVVMSLDGRPEVNDRNRKTAAGGGSYELIVPKFKKLLSDRDGKDYYIRGTFTRENLDFCADVLHIVSEGFNSISVEPVIASPDSPYSIRESDLPLIFEEYDKLAQVMAEDDSFSFFHFNIDLEQGPCVIKRIRGCGAGCEYVAVTPEGDIYPCHQFVGKEEYKMGSVHDGSFDLKKSERFSGYNLYSREGCEKCWAKFYCSGGCSASNLMAEGNIKKPNHIACQMERKRIECAIALKALKSV
ncbi:MAG: thioether cross-link-forming SCIFF peptide maturase [Oscillospiraceae bacterium]|jgi:uncharacterized protein